MDQLDFGHLLCRWPVGIGWIDSRARYTVDHLVLQGKHGDVTAAFRTCTVGYIDRKDGSASSAPGGTPPIDDILTDFGSERFDGPL